MLKLDRLDNWYKFVVIVGDTHFIDGDSAIPASIPLKYKDFYVRWWTSQKERTAQRMAKMLLEL